MTAAADISVVIPSYGRESVLVDTLTMLLALPSKPGEILIIDQTPCHEASTGAALGGWLEVGAIRLIMLSPPSIPRAMNLGLLQAVNPYVLFLDDDIVPDKDLVAAHARALGEADAMGIWCLAGQVLQPGQTPIDPATWTHSWFPFHSNQRQIVRDVMAGNLCLDRRRALELGGFDENFVGSAFGFETEFARRVVRGGGRILFEPKASIRHLRASRGGTRSYGHHLTTWAPYHAVGKYYLAFRGGWRETLKTLAIQPLRSIRTKHHLKAPWWIPGTLIAEMLGILWALRLVMKGPQFADRGSSSQPAHSGSLLGPGPEG